MICTYKQKGVYLLGYWTSQPVEQAARFLSYEQSAKYSWLPLTCALRSEDHECLKDLRAQIHHEK